MTFRMMFRGLLAACLIAGGAAVCSAQSVQVTPLAKDGRILVTLRINDVFTEEVRTARHCGLRITFVYDIELKRSTALWVDRTLAAASVTATIEYDILTRRYLATRREDGRLEKLEMFEREEDAISCRSSAGPGSRAIPSTTCASARTPCHETPPSCGHGKAGLPGSPSSRFFDSRPAA